MTIDILPMSKDRGLIKEISLVSKQKKALSEYEKFNKKQNIESDFDKQVKTLEKERNKHKET